MSTFIWQDTVKVTTREMTRAQHIAAARDLMRFAQSDPEEFEFATRVDEIVMASATSGVYLKNENGEWARVEKRATFTYQDERYTITIPLTPGVFQALPTTLVIGWADKAIADNDYFRETLFFGQGGTNDSTSTNEPPSAAAPSTEQPVTEA